jgi:hypothetical protein
MDLYGVSLVKSSLPLKRSGITGRQHEVHHRLQRELNHERVGTVLIVPATVCVYRPLVCITNLITVTLTSGLAHARTIIDDLAG